MHKSRKGHAKAILARLQPLPNLLYGKIWKFCLIERGVPEFGVN